MRKIYLLTFEHGEKIAFSSFNSFLNSFPLDDALFLRKQFRGRGKPFEKKDYQKEEYFFEKYKIKIETVPLCENLGVGYIEYPWLKDLNLKQL